MIRYLIFVLFLISGLLIVNCSGEHSDTDHHVVTEKTAGEKHGHDHDLADGPRPVVLELPDNLLTVLRLEMAEITSGMGVLLNHLARGEQGEAADIAEKIHDSFILKQKLSETDLKQLVSLLPEDFVKMDRTFHSNAAKVAGFARQNDFASAMNLYGEMTQACIDCHRQFAKARFPGLTGQ